MVLPSFPSHRAAKSPKIKFHWWILSLFLLHFSTHMTAIESFVVPPLNDIGVPTRVASSVRSVPKSTTKLFQDLERSMEFRGIPNKPIQSERKYNVSLLVIDHYDSFTYNLVDMLAQLTVDPPVVVAKDAMDATTDGMASFFDKFDGIVLSPGPGTPQEQPALSHMVITENPNLPVFGVCLGHQLMSLAYGARVDRAPVPIHGQDHRILQSEKVKEAYPSLFEDLPSSFRVVRYHSLCAYDLPEKLSVTARSGDDVVQAIQHESNPHYGVQFHPESIGTENGMKLLENFLRVAETIKLENKDGSAAKAPLESQEPPEVSTSSTASTQSSSRFKIMVHKVSGASLNSLQAFEKYYSRQSHSIWLDSSSSHTGRGELDILAAPSRSEDIIEYHIDDNHSGDQDILSQLETELFADGPLNAASTGNIGWVTVKDDKTSLEWVPENNNSMNKNTLDEALPFNYRGGYLGFLGYEVRHDTQRYLQELEGGLREAVRENTDQSDLNDKENSGSRVPTAAFFLARQSMVYHHPSDQWYLVGLAEDDKEIEQNLEWMKTIDRELKEGSSDDFSQSKVSSISNQHTNVDKPTIEFVPNRPKETYENDIEKCHEFIKKGDSYELCLTNQLEARVSGKRISTFDLYKTIRQINPAPYSSYFRWNLASKSDTTKAGDEPLSTSMAICSSSPERFMSVSRQQPHPEMPAILQAEAKPIKGTCARVMPENGICRTDAETREDDRRARSLELSLKNRAENLMIVDLLRNDMSRVCKTGSVHVSKLMGIESFATVHQMVSTIRGTLSDSYNSIDLLRASFPGGSMTGAPKIRTMEILEKLEENVDRGAYSGSLGYLSVNGCMDMNIMIRSATVTPSEQKDEWKVSIGAGGAITALSEAEDEYDEMLLKARAVRQAVEKWAATIDSDDEATAISSDTPSDASSNTTSIYVES